MFIDKTPDSFKSLLTCKIHNSDFEYSIIRRYTNVVYYYIIFIIYYIMYTIHICAECKICIQTQYILDINIYISK